MTAPPDKTVLTIMDICGSCITDVVYNHLYSAALTTSRNNATPLIDAYRQTLLDYSKQSTRAKFHITMLNTMHYYLRVSTRMRQISYPDFVAMYAAIFAPNAPIMDTDSSINVLTAAIGAAVRAFIAEIVAKHLHCIVEDHSDPGNVEMLQDLALKVLLQQREAISAPVERHSPVLDKLTSAFKRTADKHSALEKKHRALLKRNKEMAAQFKELQSMFLRQLETQKTYVKVIQDLRTRLAEESAPAEAAPAEESAPADTTGPIDNDDLFCVTYIEPPSDFS